jgi:hypothetical protein
MDIKKIKIEDLNLPLAPAQAPQIDWGEDFLNWDFDKQNRYLKRLCSALNHATDNIQKERNDALDKLHEMQANLENADNNVSVQKDIVIRAITSHNAEKQELIKRLQELEKEVKFKQELIDLYEAK